MKIYLIRHSLTKYNEEKRYLGHSDIELSSSGKKLLEDISYDFKYDFLMTSPLKRCIQTTEILFDKAYEIDNEFKEFNFGIFEGKTYLELKDTFEYNAWINDFDNYQIPCGERSLDFKKRVIKRFLEIEKSDYETVVIVCHGGVIRTIVEFLTEENFFDIEVEYGKGYLIENRRVEKL